MAFSQLEFYSPQEEFEPTYQKSYSHGLEKIYALENVDIKSIRRIASRPEPLKIPAKRFIDKCQSSSQQLELPLGTSFQTEIAPFIYQEPIQILGLSKKVENWLLSTGKRCLGDLLDEQRQNLVTLSGIGLGHLDEISSLLQSYLEVHLYQHENIKINFDSWMKTLLGAFEPKKCAVLLAHFDLPPLMPLSPAETAEVRKLSAEQRTSWRTEMFAKCRSADKMEQVKNHIAQMVSCYLKPWLFQHEGLATYFEIEEYLFKLSGLNEHMPAILSFFSQVYFEGSSFLNGFLQEVEPGIYADRIETIQAYQIGMDIFYSYFYREDLFYPLENLIGLASRELASQWYNFSERLMERILRISKYFRVRKNAHDQLIVKLS